MPKKVLSIDGREVEFSANALTPRLYRHQYNRDLARDLNQIKKKYEDVKADEEKFFEAMDLEIFENVAYIMAKQADPEVPKTADEWLETFQMFSIYQILPEILGLWSLNIETTAIPGKK